MAETDQDSAVGGLGSYQSSTYSIDSALYEKVEENGRKYHIYKDGKYMLPNDEIELNRLDIQNKMWSICFDEKLILAPIGENPQHALDIGTGTGLWAINFAEAYPSAQVIGTDLSAVAPEYIPQNLTFEIEDAEDEWLYPMKFDLIHGRALTTCFSDTKSIFQKAFNALRPGGYLEMQDLCLQIADDGTMDGTALEEWQEHVRDATKSMGISWDKTKEYKAWMEEVGFEDVVETRFRWPSGQWSADKKERKLGAWMQVQVDHGILESASTRLFMVKLEWSKERLKEFLGRCKQDMRNLDIHAYNPAYVVYGRKPLEPLDG